MHSFEHTAAAGPTTHSQMSVDSSSTVKVLNWTLKLIWVLQLTKAAALLVLPARTTRVCDETMFINRLLLA